MPPPSHTYEIHGVTVASEIPLNEAECESATPDLLVRRGPVGMVDNDMNALLAEYSAFGRTWYQAYAHGDDYLLRFPSLSDFVVSADLERVEVRPQAGVADEAIALLVVGTTVAFVLTLRGHCVLHAGAVAIDGRAVAFAGIAGTGKSTCTALLCSQGAGLVADDVLRVDLGDIPEAIRGASSIRLRGRAAELIQLFASPPPTRHTYDDRLAVYPHRAESRLPLGAVVLPRPNREIEQVLLEPVSGAGALTNLIISARFMGWRDAGQQRRQFEQMGLLSRAVPIYRVQVPWKEQLSAQVADELFDVLRTAITA